MENPAHGAIGDVYVYLALICETILQEITGMTSYVRVFDQAELSGVPIPEGQNVSIPFPTWLCFGLKSGTTIESRQLRLRFVRPDGTWDESQDMPMHVPFSGPENGEYRGANINLNLTINVQQEGTYWFELHDDEAGRLLTRTPLMLVVPQQGADQAQPTAAEEQESEDPDD